jgi:hypothetical protein
VSLTDKAIVQIREPFRTGALPPGSITAPANRDAALGQAAALLHVSNTERWLREHLRTAEAATPSIDGPGLLTRPDPA